MQNLHHTKHPMEHFSKTTREATREISAKQPYTKIANTRTLTIFCLYNTESKTKSKEASKSQG